jgi:hypothetical protein
MSFKTLVFILHLFFYFKVWNVQDKSASGGTKGLEGLFAVAGTHCQDRAQLREETASWQKLF